MNDVWFSPDTAGLFSYLSLLSMCALFSVPARRGQQRALAFAVWNLLTVSGVLLMAAGGAAAASGQPSHVTRTLLVSGAVVALVFLMTRRGLTRCYQEADLRRTVAADL